MRSSREITQRMANNTRVKSSLCFLNPLEVYRGLLGNVQVKRWLRFVSEFYDPEPRDILLIYPCSAQKPYYEARSYRRLLATLSHLGELRSRIHLVTVSEPFGLIPEEFQGKSTKWHDWGNSWYDCPGLFEWWCKRHGQPYSVEYLEKSIDLLAAYVAKFLSRTKRRHTYSRVVAFVRTYSSQLNLRQDHTHRRIVELASARAGVAVTFLPSKHTVRKIVAERGSIAWDFQGVSHPLAQRALLRYLRSILDEA